MAAAHSLRAERHSDSTGSFPGISWASPCSRLWMSKKYFGEMQILGLKPEMGSSCAGAQALPGDNNCSVQPVR